MVKITERVGKAHVFNLNNGTALRLYARQSQSLSNALADSPEIVSAEKMGLISLVEVEKEKTETKKTKGGKK